MKVTKITIVAGDDWEGIYADGNLVSEGHSHSTRECFEIASKYGSGVAVDWIEADYEWLHDRGCLPDRLSKVKGRTR